ncbi:MAG: arsenic transporter [Propionibacteriaceae bacterium]|nr:arsenic transporter [Propionibacteriaceae bacterium]
MIPVRPGTTVSCVHLEDLLFRVGPILGFLVCITVVAELADGIGVFQVAARGASQVAGGSVFRLWGMVVVVAVLCTAVLSLDTTAVLLTPLVLAMAKELDLNRELFAFTAVWLANTASLFLPVSNLTNLLAYGRLSTSTVGFAALMWPAAVTSVVVTVLMLMIIFRRSLRGRFRLGPVEPPADRTLLIIGMVVCAGLGPAFLLGVDVLAAAAAAALVLTLACVVRARRLLRWNLLPWKLVLGVAVLFVAVQVAHDYGLGTALTVAAGHGDRWLDLLHLGAVAAMGANLVDNLPTYLAMEPTAAGSAQRTAALLVGVNAGPLITPWASLATLLWAARCRTAGVEVSWLRFGRRGLLLVPLLLAASLAALVLVHG